MSFGKKLEELLSQKHLRARLRVDVWIEESRETLSQVEMILDDPFRLDQVNQAGIALQRGAWEAFMKAVENMTNENSDAGQDPGGDSPLGSNDDRVPTLGGGEDENK